MTHPIDTSPEAIAALLDGVTPGPWEWQVSRSTMTVELSGGKQTKAGGDLTVMSFARYGMRGAAPVFWTWDGLTATRVERADKLAIAVPGREHHANWFARIDHPDARFIAAARELVPALAAEIARLTAERDEARAQVAMACVAMRDRCADMVEREGHSLHVAIRHAPIPTDATAALAARDAAPVADAPPTIGGAELDALVQRLRAKASLEMACWGDDSLYREAADAITALRAQPDWKAMAEPDYCYNPEDWEYTQTWDARHELAESVLDYGRDKGPVRISTLISGPDKWVARVPLDTDGDGEADDWEDRWFDSEEAARADLAKMKGE